MLCLYGLLLLCLRFDFFAIWKKCGKKHTNRIMPHFEKLSEQFNDELMKLSQPQESIESNLCLIPFQTLFFFLSFCISSTFKIAAENRLVRQIKTRFSLLFETMKRTLRSYSAMHIHPQPFVTNVCKQLNLVTVVDCQQSRSLHTEQVCSLGGCTYCLLFGSKQHSVLNRLGLYALRTIPCSLVMVVLLLLLLYMCPYRHEWKQGSLR